LGITGLLYIGTFTLLLGVFYMIMLVRYVKHVLHLSIGIELDEKGIYFIFPMTIQRQFIAWEIIEKIEEPKEGKEILYLCIKPSLTKKEIKNQVNKTVYRRIKNHILKLHNSTNLETKDLYKQLQHWLDYRNIRNIPDINDYYFDNIVYTKRNMFYNIGLMISTVVWLFTFFITDVLLQTNRDIQIFIHLIYFCMIITLLIYSIRFDKIAPRGISVSENDFSYTYVIRRTKRRRYTIRKKINRTEINSVIVKDKRVIINKKDENVITLNNTQLSKEDTILLKEQIYTL
ncbi:MAG: hypothetical protein ACK5LC_03020, partial [Coprobacillaceae bacterium]